MKRKNINKPPALANRLALWFIDESLLEELEGDLIEAYKDRIRMNGRLYANMMYWVDALYLIIGFRLRSFNTKTNRTNVMIDFLKNYWTIAIRRLVKDSGLSWINFIGLMSGISICLFILLYIIDEKSYNNFYPDAERVYRIYSKIEFNKNKPSFSPESPYLSHKDVTTSLAGVGAVVNIKNVPNAIMSIGENTFYENLIFFADANVFNLFSLPFTHGNPDKSLAATHAMVITRSMALKFFGQEDVIGKNITITFANVTTEFSITGVIEDPSHNSTFRPNFLISTKVFEMNFPGLASNWGTVGWETYVKVRKEAPREQIESLFDNLITSKMGERKFYSLYLQPLTDIHLNANAAPIPSTGNYNFLFVLGSIGIFILVLACFNYINLTTSRISLRDKEIALRKVNGARYGDLIKQFYLECVILCALSFATAAVLVITLLPAFNQVAEKEIPFSFLTSTNVLVSFAAVFLVTALLSGGYPAIVLSRRSTLLNTVQSRSNVSVTGISFRQYLTAFQIVIASILLVATLLIIQQTRYLSTKEIGLDKEQLLVIDLQDIDLSRKYEYLKNELGALPGVQSVSASNLVPLYGTGKVSYSLRPESTGTINNMVVDESFREVYSIRLKEGRWLSGNIPTDINNAVILNQAAVDFFQLDTPIGQTITLQGNREQQAQVIGITENFNYEPLFKQIDPLIMHIDTVDLGFYFPYRKLTLKLEGDKIPETLERITNKWKSMAGYVPLTYSFFDDSFNAAYRQEQRMSWLLGLATLLALIIVGLGLAGISLFVAELRKREIAIRKVLGGNVWHIVFLLTSKYVKLVLLAFCVSTPITYYLMSKWLSHFAFKISISPFTYLVSLAVLLVLSWGLTAMNTYRSSQVNPAKTLRN